MTILSSVPASSTPWTIRSAKRPSVDFRLTKQGYNRPDAATRELAAVPVFLSVREIEHRGPHRCLRDPRARARAVAGRDPRGPLCAEQAHAATALAPARPAGSDSGTRRRDGRGHETRARVRTLRLELSPDFQFTRSRDRGRSDRNVPRGDPVRLEHDDVAR